MGFLHVCSTFIINLWIYLLLTQPYIYLIKHGALFLNLDFPSSCFSPLETLSSFQILARPLNNSSLRLHAENFLLLHCNQIYCLHNSNRRACQQPQPAGDNTFSSPGVPHQHQGSVCCPERAGLSPSTEPIPQSLCASGAALQLHLGSAQTCWALILQM